MSPLHKNGCDIFMPLIDPVNHPHNFVEWKYGYSLGPQPTYSCCHSRKPLWYIWALHGWWAIDSPSTKIHMSPTKILQQLSDKLSQITMSNNSNPTWLWMQHLLLRCLNSFKISIVCQQAMCDWWQQMHLGHFLGLHNIRVHGQNAAFIFTLQWY